MRTLDRYVIREILPPFLLALGLFTFVLAINPVLDYAHLLLAKGVSVPMVGLLLLTLVPQALSLTIPMAFLTGLLMALGRISGDRESVALLACGVSPLRLLRPVLAVATVVAGVDMYVLMKVKPDANQAFREITFRHLTEKTETDIKPRVFFEQFPNMVLFIGDSAPRAGWSKILLADTNDPQHPVVTLAEAGKLVIDRQQRQVSLVLSDATQYTPGTPDRSESGTYTTTHFNPLTIKVTAESVFGSGDIAYPRGYPEMGYGELRAEADKKRAQGLSPHNEIMHMQQMFSFPAACLVFGLLGLPLGLNTRKEGRLAALAVGLAVIASYYLLMQVAQDWVKGEAWVGGASLPAAWARWVPNVLFGIIGVVALWRSARSGNGRPLIVLPRLSWRRPRAGASAVVHPTALPVLVVRMPSVRFPFPRLLDRYVSRQYLKMLGLSFLALLTLYYIGEAVDLAEKIFKGQAGYALLLRYLWYATPKFVALVVPIATLVGVLGTIGALTRSGELMVMRASGVSLYRAALPLILFAAVWGGALFFLEERVLGDANRTAEQLRDTIRGRPPHTVTIANLPWMVGEDGRIYHYANFEPARPASRGATLTALSVFETADSPYRLTTHTYASSATSERGSWSARKGWRQSFSESRASREEFEQRTLTLPPVEDFRRAQVDASQMSYRELRQYVRRLGASGFNVAEQSVNLHHKVAFPAVALVMTLLAVPFGVTTGKKGALYGIGLAAILAGAYFLLLTVFMAVGAAGVLPPVLAAWAPNLLFAAGALFMMFTVRT